MSRAGCSSRALDIPSSNRVQSTSPPGGALLRCQRTDHHDARVRCRRCVEYPGDRRASRGAGLASHPEMLPFRPGSALKRFERGHRFPSGGHRSVSTRLLILSSRCKVISTKRISAFHSFGRAPEYQTRGQGTAEVLRTGEVLRSR